MIILFDLSRVILFPKDKTYAKDLNPLYAKLTEKEKEKFWEYFELNNSLLAALEELQKKQDIYMFTSGLIQDAPQLKQALKVFKKIYSAEKMNMHKTNPRAYQLIARDLNKNQLKFCL